MSRRFLYERGSDEFSRVVTFTDGVFAIAMTLLVVQIEIPKVDPSDLGSAVSDQTPLIVSFFLSFIVIGYYWMAHHRFFALLTHVEPGLMLINLIYLSAIAFLPFPTGLVGSYESKPLAVVIYAGALGAASFLEVAMMTRARHISALKKNPTPEAFRFAVFTSLAPVVIFALSIPIAFYSTTLALLFWIVNMPVQWALDRWLRPAKFEESFQ
ncbi:MAG: TMEM175 family protein [Acidimicrobiia bacterium]